MKIKTGLHSVPRTIMYDHFSRSLIVNCCCTEELTGSPFTCVRARSHTCAGAATRSMLSRWSVARLSVKRGASDSKTGLSWIHVPWQPSGNCTAK